MGATISSIIASLAGILIAYLAYRGKDEQKETETLLEENNALRGAIDRYSDRPHTPDDTRKLFARAKVAARERDKAK